MMRIILDPDRCTGLGMCESIAPDFFEVNDDGTLTLLRTAVPAGDLPLIEEAVDACPTCALSLTSADAEPSGPSTTQEL